MYAITNGAARKPRDMAERGRPKLTGDRAESLRAMVWAIVRTDHAGVQKATADALGVTRSALNDMLNERVGAGMAIQDGLVRYLKRPIEEIVAAKGDLDALRAGRVGATSVEVVFGELPSWSELLAGAKAIDPRDGRRSRALLPCALSAAQRGAHGALNTYSVF